MTVTVTFSMYLYLFWTKSSTTNFNSYSQNLLIHWLYKNSALFIPIPNLKKEQPVIMNVLCWNRAFVQYDMENPSPDRQDVNQIQQQDDPIELGTIYVVYSICKRFSPIWLDEKSQYPLLHKLISKMGEKTQTDPLQQKYCMKLKLFMGHGLSYSLTQCSHIYFRSSKIWTTQYTISPKWW